MSRIEGNFRGAKPVSCVNHINYSMHPKKIFEGKKKCSRVSVRP